MRVIVEEPEKLEKYLEKREKATEVKALILKMVVELKDIKQVAKIAGVTEQTIYEWIEEWNKKRNNK